MTPAGENGGNGRVECYNSTLRFPPIPTVGA